MDWAELQTHNRPAKGPRLSCHPAAWLSLADACQEVAQCLNSPGGNRLVVHFFLPGTEVRIDIGNVRAAGVLCVLGIGFGIGTYVLYKIYDRFIRPKVRRKRPKSDEDCRDEREVHEDSMGNEHSTYSDVPVYYRPGSGVSLYKPLEAASTVPTTYPSIRRRKTGSHSSMVTGSFLNGKLNDHIKNGLVPIEYQNIDDSVVQSWLPVSPECNMGKLEELNLVIDDDECVESDNEGGDNHSLKGNFSPRSLYEKNSRHFNVEEYDDSQSEREKLETIEVREQNGDRTLHLNLLDSIGASSVLLTPPSDDELSSLSQPLFSSNSHKISFHSTKSDVSELHSEVADSLSEKVSFTMETADTDEERERLSPLPFDHDNTPDQSPENLLKRRFVMKLRELTRTRTLSCTSRNSSNSSLLELINNESNNSDIPAPTENKFQDLEQEILHVEDEFHDISSKLHELCDKYTDYDETAGFAIVNKIFERYPSIRVRQQEKGLNFSGRLPRGLYSQASQDESESEGNGPDLSWDLENVLDMVYSENSDSVGNSPQMLVAKLGCDHVEDIAEEYEENGLEDITFDSTVEMDGSLYEDQFHLKLGSKALSSREAVVPVSTLARSDSPLTYDSDHTHRCDSPICTQSKHRSESPVLMETEDELAYESPVYMETGNKDRLIGSESEYNCESPIFMDTEHKQRLGGIENEHMCETDSTDSVSRGSVPDASDKQSVCNVGARYRMSEYADNEWRGDTTRANLMKMAYREIPDHCQYCHLRRIRGDNYCAIRGTVYQTLVNDLPPAKWASSDTALQELAKQFRDKDSALRQWTFGGRIPFTDATRLDVMCRCLRTLYAKFQEMKHLSDHCEREERVRTTLNSDPLCDLELMEGVKLLMFLSATRLHSDIQAGNEVPVFAWLMFARDTSEDVKSFVKNHLNPVGDSGGLEQVEMFLLGYSLGVVIRVFRLQQFGQEDFVSHYPEDSEKHWPTIPLIAEDDRHYNVPVL